MTSVSFEDNRLSSSCSATTYSSLNSDVSVYLAVRVKRKILSVSLHEAQNPEFMSPKSLGRPSGRTDVNDLLHCFGLIVTYLLTPQCRVLLEKLTGLQLVKKFPAFHGTRRLITALKSFRHLSLSWASSIQSSLISVKNIFIIMRWLR